MRTSQAARPRPHNGNARAALCRAWLRAEEMVEKHIGKTLAARPYWRSLMELYLAEAEDRTMFSSCFLTGESSSSVHRRSNKLAKLGALTRQQDPADLRRNDLKLTPAIRSQIERVLDAIIALDHECHREG